jgi:hypothetical protein
VPLGTGSASTESLLRSRPSARTRDKMPYLGLTPAELRDKCRLTIEEARNEPNLLQKRTLAARAFDMAQHAEEDERCADRASMASVSVRNERPLRGRVSLRPLRKEPTWVCQRGSRLSITGGNRRSFRHVFIYLEVGRLLRRPLHYVSYFHNSRYRISEFPLFASPSRDRKKDPSRRYVPRPSLH